MARTFQQLYQGLQTWLGLNTSQLPDAVAKDIVNIVQREVCRLHDLRYNEVSDTFATADGDRDYAVPATWSRPYSLWYRRSDNNAVVFLEQVKERAEFDRLFPDATVEDYPTHYMVWKDQLYLGKTPDRVITINRNYYAILADLVADGDTNDLTNGAWEVLHYLGLAEAEMFGIEDHRMAGWRNRGNELLSALVIEHARARSTGRRSTAKEPG